MQNTNNKQLLRSFCDIQNNQGQGRGSLLKSEADNPNLLIALFYIEQKKVCFCFSTHCTQHVELDMIALKNHAARSNMTWLPVTLIVLDMIMV